MASAECLETEECTRIVFEAVYKNSVSLLEYARYEYSEMQLLTSLAKCNEDRETPLAIAMKGKNVPIIEQLLQVLRNCDRKNNQCQLIYVMDQLSHHIPIEVLIEYLLQVTNSESWIEFIIQVFIESTAFTRQDKIIALELIGANKLLSSFFDPISALMCWREAMTLRFNPADGEPLLKIPAVCVVSAASSVVFGSATEVATMGELDLLQEDVEHNFESFDHIFLFSCVKRMKIQALLVTRRISNQAGLEHPYLLYLTGLCNFADVFEREETSLRERKTLINIYLLILEQLNGCDPKQLPRKTFDVFNTAICLLSNLFCELLEKEADSPAREELTFKNLLAPTECISTISKFFSDPAKISSVEFEDTVKFQYFSFPKIVNRFLIVLDAISPQISNQEKQKLEEYYSYYIRNFFPDQTVTVLHEAIDLFWFFDFNLHPNVINTINLIIKLGGNPNAVDEDGQTPLHILAGDRSFLLDECSVPIIRALVDAETHLDRATHNGETVIGILKDNLLSIKESGEIALPYFESLVNTVFPLRCYCARVIRLHGIPFGEDRIPSHLQGFVAMH